MFEGLEELVKIIRERKNSSPDRSYTNKILNDKEFQNNVRYCINPYGDGKSANRIIEILKK